MASALGVPITTNECTVKKLHISYARMLIEIDITRDVQQTVRIKGDDDDEVLLI